MDPVEMFNSGTLIPPDRDGPATPTTARQAAELAALIVDAMQVHVGRDVHEVSPTLTGNVIITDHQGRTWLLRLIPEADERDESEDAT